MVETLSALSVENLLALSVATIERFAVCHEVLARASALCLCRIRTYRALSEGGIQPGAKRRELVQQLELRKAYLKQLTLCVEKIKGLHKLRELLVAVAIASAADTISETLAKSSGTGSRALVRRVSKALKQAQEQCQVFKFVA